MAKKMSSATEALLEMAEDSTAAASWTRPHTKRSHFAALAQRRFRTAKPISGEEIRKLREQANLSQAAFARYLNLTLGYISQLERGAKQPKGPALALLNVIRRKGHRSHSLGQRVNSPTRLPQIANP